MAETKVCSRKECPHEGRPQPLSEFAKCASQKDGLQRWCKTCKAEYHQANRGQALARMSQYREDHRDELIAYDRQYYRDHHEESLEARRQWHAANRDQDLERVR